MRDRGRDRPVYVISIAADLTGLHPRTLRIYEERGLLSPRRRNRIRLYSEDDIERVRLIRHFTHELGVNLAGVKLLLEVYEQQERGQAGGAAWTITRRSVRVRSGSDRAERDAERGDGGDRDRSRRHDGRTDDGRTDDDSDRGGRAR